MGSANPSVSFSALWSYLIPALDHIMKSSTNDPAKAPALDVGLYAGIHTAIYNYFNFQNDSMTRSFVPISNNKEEKDGVMSGADLYTQLDNYLSDVCSEIFLAAPHDDTTLIHYLIPAFTRFQSGSQSVNRLLQYVNRHYVKRAVDDDRGWLRLNEVLQNVAKSITSEDTREKISKKLKEKKTEELRVWGYVDGGTPESMAAAEAAAEAGSDPDRIVPLNTLALRRFRLDTIGPLLAIPKSKKAKQKAKQKAAAAVANGAPPPPKGRLARAVKHLLESDEIEETDRRRMAIALAELLRKCGVPMNHVLRKKLDKYIATGEDED
ncbi:hypothetical protein DL96DRAFT_1665965 [Flagelloscypha sp. PMI_526]|nr:hypothetical protein DL96DRAFT_1665965 [Flagelloscypha sp. PMI_526]